MAEAKHVRRARERAHEAIGDPPLTGDGKHDAHTRPADDWDVPVPLGCTFDSPPFPFEKLPGWLADWVQCEADATQVPVDLPAMLALAVAGAALAGNVRIIVRDGWTEPTNLFTVTALPPGDRKSKVFADAIKPVQLFEQMEQVRMQPIIAELASEHRVMEARLKALEGKAAKADHPESIAAMKAEAVQLARELVAHHVPDPPQMYCDDITPEALGNLMARQGGRVLQASPEGTAFEIAKGRYSETANFDVYLKGHAGDSYRVGRISRTSDIIASPALSLALAVQPDVIAGLAEQISMRGRGFLARFLYAVPMSRVGRRSIGSESVPWPVVNAYGQNMLAIWSIQGATDEHGQAAPHCLPFAPRADASMKDFEAWLEPQLAEGQPLSHLAGWANKLAGACARIAAILHVAERIGSSQPWQCPIQDYTVEAAIAIGRDYLIPHAQAAFGMMGTDPRLADAKRLLKWLADDSVNSVKTVKGGLLFVRMRDMHAAVWGGSRKVEELEQVIELMVKHGYLRAVPDESRQGPGRKPVAVHG